MKKITQFAVLITAMLCLSVSNDALAQKPESKSFGKTKSGRDVEIYTIKNDKGLVAKVMTRGATLVNLMVPDKEGKSEDVILGFDDVSGYESDANQYFGNTTGRVCNRIAKGKFTLDGKEYTLEVNNEPNHLHGGVKKSLDKLVWRAKPFDREKASGVTFNVTSKDGDEGYPGNLKLTVTYAVSKKENRLTISYKATTDKATPVNLTNHAYFNLAGQGSKTAMNHILKINATSYTPTDDTLIPTGKIEKVAGTNLDFTKATRIGKRVAELDESPALGYDHNYVLAPKPDGKNVGFAAMLRHPASGRQMRIGTSEPGIQFYSGNFLEGQEGKGGKTYAHRSAVCLETQHYPDSVNQKDFPSTILKPGEEFKSMTSYTFTIFKPMPKNDAPKKADK